MFKLKSVIARMSLNWLCLQSSDMEIGENFTISFVHFSRSGTVKLRYFPSAFDGDPIVIFTSTFDLSTGHFFDELSWLPKATLLVNVNGFFKCSESSNDPNTHNWNGNNFEVKVLWFPANDKLQRSPKRSRRSGNKRQKIDTILQPKIEFPCDNVSQ